MDLFHKETDNLLPYDGTVHYYPTFLSQTEANNYFKTFLEKINWENDVLTIFGKTIVTKRKVAWYAEKPYKYTYSKQTKTAILFSSEFKKLVDKISTKTNHSFNSCLLNLYHSGEEGMSWHSDNEPEMGENPIIASVSLGAERKFSLKHKKTKEKVSINLQHGSLLVMGKDTQTNWLHSLPKTKKVNKPRINLTFRQFIENSI